MILIPSHWIAIVTGAAGIAWILFARSQKGRYHAASLTWLSVPFFMFCVVYTYFTFVDVPIDTRAMYARAGILSIALSQAIILLTLYFINRGQNGGPK